MSQTIITLDVRGHLRTVNEPFPRIMEAVGCLRGVKQLRIVAPFEPRPLIGVLAAEGSTAKITQIEGGDSEIIFSTPAQAECDEEPFL